MNRSYLLAPIFAPNQYPCQSLLAFATACRRDCPLFLASRATHLKTQWRKVPKNSCVNCQSLLAFATACRRDCPRIAFLPSCRVLSGNTLPPPSFLPVSYLSVCLAKFSSQMSQHICIFFFFQKPPKARMWVHSDILLQYFTDTPA